MCGIIGYTGKLPAQPILLDGLRALEYRGYDSAGISVLSRGKLKTWKSAGKLSALTALLPGKPSPGLTGIGHTRWATHGEANDANAHPHTDSGETVSVVHNGILENASALRSSLESRGIKLRSDTDSEVLAHLIALDGGATLTERVRNVLSLVKGTYGLAIVDSTEPGTVIAARNGSPVIIGLAENATLVASDIAALIRHTREFSHLEDGDIATITQSSVQVTALDAAPRSRERIRVEAAPEDYDRGGHKHFMYREITDQPDATKRTLSGRLDPRFGTAHLGGLNLDARALLNTARIKILGCGSAYYAGRAGASMIETLARIPADAEPAAEFRYRNPVIDRDTLYIVISQSGETTDTLEALREIQRKGGQALGIVNAVGSTIAREVDGGIYMHAGPEISVASTKTFSCSLTCFALLALYLGRLRDISPQRGQSIVHALDSLPSLITSTLQLEDEIKSIAANYCHSTSAFFVGRASAYPTALEGAQKLKEISYIHAEAYPSSELKHGPLALITEQTPTIAIVPNDELLDKSISTLEEISARKGPLIVLAGTEDSRVKKLADAMVVTPEADVLLQPILMGVALQLFAYHCALALDRDIDQPRNLAKSVTVE